MDRSLKAFIFAPLSAASLMILLLSASAQPQPTEDESSAVGVPSGDIFGFTSPTDVGDPGDKGLALEGNNLLGKRVGTYRFQSLKTQFSTTLAPNLAVAVSPFVSSFHVRGLPELEDRSGARFDGVSGEISYRVLERSATFPAAVTLSVEPRAARVDPATGERVSAYGTELKLFIDTVLVPERLYGALNFNYAFAAQRSAFSPDQSWERSSGTNLSGALAYQISSNVFLGAEARYLAAFSGASLNRFEGNALFVGPNLMLKLSEKAAINVAWTPQLVGRATGANERLDLDNFERHQLRMKFSTSF